MLCQYREVFAVGSNSADVSSIITIIFAAVLVMVGLGLNAVAKDLRTARDRGEPPMLQAWYGGGWYERHPTAIGVSARIMVVVGTVLLVVGVVVLAGTVA